MVVAAVGEHYKCHICGNEVAVMTVGGGVLICCGQEMGLLTVHEPKPVDDEIPV